MLTKHILLAIFCTIFLNTRTQAYLTPQQCQTECTQEKACKFKYKQAQCERECPGFKAAEVCQASPSASPRPAMTTHASNPRPLPKPPGSPRISESTPPAPQNKASIEADTLQMIVNKLITYTSGHCHYNLDAQLKKVNEQLLPKPEGYEGPYKTADEYRAIISQVYMSIDDTANKVNAKIAAFRDAPAEKRAPIGKFFEDVFRDIHQNIIANCDKYNVMIRDEITPQITAVNNFKPKSKSALKRFKNKIFGE